MIRSFHCKETEKIWLGKLSYRLPGDIQHIVRRKLRMLNNAEQLNDLRTPPNNRLEALKGEKAGEYSIRVNNQWRLCFKWSPGGVEGVILVDSH